MSLQRDTVTIPITKGVDLTSEPRLIEAPTLLEAVNSRFSRGGGSTKRRGHSSTLIRGESSIPPGVDVSQYPWVFGWGYMTGNRVNSAADQATCGTGPHPNAGRLYGLASRDQETMVWSGDRMFSYTPGQAASSGQISAEIGNAVMPSLKSYPLAKVQTGQTHPDFADNGIIKVVTWINPADTKIHYSVYDSVSLAPIVVDKVMGAGIFQHNTGRGYHVVPLGTYVHIVAADAGDNLLKVFTLSNGAPNVETYTSYGACLGFDLWKVDETYAAMIINTDGTHVKTSYLGQTGASYGNAISTTLARGAAITTVAIAVHPTTLDVCLATADNTVTPKIFVDFVTLGGTTTASITAATVSNSGVVNMTCAPKYVLSSTGKAIFDLYYDNAAAVLQRQRVQSSGTIGTRQDRFNCQLATKAFRCGDRTFVWAGKRSTLQSVWLLMDESLLPVGHQDFVVANIQNYSSDTSPMLGSVNWYTTQSRLDGNTANFIKFHFALGFRVRVPVTSTNTGTGTPVSSVFTEPSVKVGELNMLPTLRSAQAGRCTYFAGAQVWSYDGVELVEAGFHYGPELPTLSAIAGGTLANPGTYSYRVDLCYKNAQNEEVRSISILSNSVATTGTNKKIQLVIPTIITRRVGTYFLVYRNANVNGVPLTNWWLLNSRDPTSASFLANDLTVDSVVLLDDGTVTDTAIQTNELHPATAGDIYLQPISAPACEIISAGKDRLWVAGGELPPGQVAPSRLFQPGDIPTFNSYLNLQVDRSSEAITAIGFVGEITAFFRKNSTYVMDGDGPDNVSNGAWSPPRLALADLGALGQESLALISDGLIFQSPSGFRLLGPGGKLSPIGVPVDQPAKVFTVSNAVVVDLDQEVRWYGADKTFVYNYLYDCWSTWTVTGVGATRDLSTGRALVARSDGYLWAETEGLWTDAQVGYTHRIRLPWLHAGQLGDFQRVRKISGIGRLGDSAIPNHTIRVEIYFDESPDWEERIEWTYPDASNNSDTWGSQVWGAGYWGDIHQSSFNFVLHSINNPVSLSQDNAWEWLRRPSRQKCSVVSIAVEDAGTPGPGFVLNAIGLELARKPGLNRTPARGGTDTYKG